jgi:predicted nucleic-acid-binding protein
LIGLDTNLLVRYFAQDDPVQSPIATEIIERRLSRDEPGFISTVAMAETVWVLDRAYRLSRDAIVAVVETILRTETLIVESEREVFLAMVALREGRGEFGDALIGALNAKSGCAHTLTFDRRALRLPGFRAPLS